MIDTVLTQLRDDRQGALDRLFELLRIPSISTQSIHNDDCAKAAKWAADDLASMGFTAEVVAKPGHPMVLAHYPGTGPHVLFYGHYDVQPVDPLNLWDSDPFDPRLDQDPAGRPVIRARGAADDKGQFMTFLEACRAWIKTSGSLPCQVTVMLEGEEESTTVHLEPFLTSHAERLKADMALICDTGMIAPRRPAVTTSLRGILMEEVIITAANKDLHSGAYGGAAMNPIRVLSKIIADLHDETGRITLDGFYDDVLEPSEAQKASWEALGVTPENFLGPVGLSELAGEQGRSLLEQIWSRPTCDVNGIIGGYTDEGSKTVLPSKASAKFSFRLVAHQDPNQVAEAFRAHVRARVPSDCQVEFIGFGGDPALLVDTSLPQVALAKEALSEAFGAPAVLVGGGGSIPIAEFFKRILGLDSLLIGFGLDDDQIHSPNEKYDLESFQLGAEAWARLLGKLGNAR